MTTYEQWEFTRATAPEPGRATSIDVADNMGAYEREQPAEQINWCGIRRLITTTARAEERRWTDPQGHKILESRPDRLPILASYWATVPGFQDPRDAMRAARLSAANHRNWPWSAAFICYVMHTAGVRRAHGFDFSRRHLNYIVGAMRNREGSDRGRPFWLVDHVEIQHEVRLAPGDLICFNRCCHRDNTPLVPPCGVKEVMTQHTYASLRNTYWPPDPNRPPRGCSHTSLVVCTVQRGGTTFVATIGGNERGSVRLTDAIALSASGGIANPQGHRIFGLIKIVECSRDGLNGC